MSLDNPLEGKTPQEMIEWAENEIQQYQAFIKIIKEQNGI